MRVASLPRDSIIAKRNTCGPAGATITDDEIQVIQALEDVFFERRASEPDDRGFGCMTVSTTM